MAEDGKITAKQQKTVEVQKSTDKAIRQRTGFGFLSFISQALLWVLVILSLLLNLTLLRELAKARDSARRAVADAIAVLDDLQDQRFSYTIVIDETLAIDTEMPIDETIPVEVHESMPISTTVVVPVKVGPLGTFPIEVPIETTVPVHLAFDVVIDQTFAARSAAPVLLQIPVEIAVEDTPLHATLDEVMQHLQDLAAELDRPVSPLETWIGPPTVEVIK